MKHPPDSFRAGQCLGPINRREVLRIGLTGMAGLSLPGLLRLQAESPVSDAKARERTAVILVWLIGGASHLETYDPKPLAPADYRGPFSAIRTKTPGLEICELLPRHARISDKFAILRSMVHSGFCHQQGAQQLLTGHPVRELRNRPDHPDLFSIAHKLRFRAEQPIPNYVGIHPTPYIGPAYLGPVYEPFAVYGDPNDAKFRVPNVGVAEKGRTNQIERRVGLRQALDRFTRSVDRMARMRAMDSFESQALNLLTSSATKDAFEISKEDPRVRERYGRNEWGQQLLLARRLVERGVELITATLQGPLCGRVHNWDDHAVNHHVFDAMKRRAPYYDQAVTALIEDLHERGLEKKVMVIVTGEFGRTPKINYQPDSASGVTQPGRDHWPSATSMLFSGGGIAEGQVIGGTDRRGEYVTSRVVGRQDFLCTLYRHLGIDPRPIEFTNYDGRPIPIVSGGKPIAELTASA